MGPGVALHRSVDRSLNARFLPRGAIRTRAVAVCDDDVALPARALSFALALFRSRSRSGTAPPLVGFFGRAHDLDPARHELAPACRGEVVGEGDEDGVGPAPTPSATTAARFHHYTINGEITPLMV
uniref:Glycosyl transferase 64 domain-containing protein n=1 Tax=Ananas comosus var. bracteatus TaxID=296719 RepID=A0A6V7NX04_ANACO|nr:unnamed protein product [Ananas comosus var. bracteatus]